MTGDRDTASGCERGPSAGPRALVAEAREKHVDGGGFNGAACSSCYEDYPCLTARLADQLERMLPVVKAGLCLVAAIRRYNAGQFPPGSSVRASEIHVAQHRLEDAVAALAGTAGGDSDG